MSVALCEVPGPVLTTVQWWAKIIVPNCDIGPDGWLVDFELPKPAPLGSLAYIPGVGPAPGTRAIAKARAEDIAHPLGFTVGAVWYDGQCDREF